MTVQVHSRGLDLPPVLRQQEARRRDLVRARRRATGLLAVIGVVYVLITVLDTGASWIGYVRATLEASLVGGLADWFAVTAVFRRPLNLPIPHTAVIVERKDQFARTLASFVQQNFLNAENVERRLRATPITERVGQWLATPRNAERVAEEAAHVAAVAIEDDRRALVDTIERTINRALRTSKVAPIVDRAVDVLRDETLQQEVIALVVPAAVRVIERDDELIPALVGSVAPRWIPKPLERRLADASKARLLESLTAASTDRQHPARRALNEWLVEMQRKLREPESAMDLELAAHALLDTDAAMRLTHALATAATTGFQRALEDPAPARDGLATIVMRLGNRLATDTALAARVDAVVVRTLRELLESFHDEIERLVTDTIERWDAEETASQLELLIGRDLQFIRLNGTIVGGIAGLCIYTVSLWIT